MAPEGMPRRDGSGSSCICHETIDRERDGAHSMFEAFLWGMVATSSLVLGALVVQLRPPGERVLGVVMAFGAGVLISAVSFELIEEAVEVSGGRGGTGLGFLTGAAVFTLGDLAISSLGYGNRKDVAGGAQDAPPFAIVLGTFLDGVPESAVLGLTVLQTGEVGVAMLVAVFVSNLPESIAASSSLLSSGWKPRHVTLLWIVIAFVCSLSAAAGYALLDGAPPSTLAFMFAFAGGAILNMLATSMMPEAYEHARRWAGISTVLGFGVAFVVNLAAT
jgi:zinc transporter, ZIP family